MAPVERVAEHARGRDPFTGAQIRIGDFRLARTPAESRAINEVSGPVLIVSASGMATGGRGLDHLKQRLPDPRNAVALVGYHAVGRRVPEDLRGPRPPPAGAGRGCRPPGSRRAARSSAGRGAAAGGGAAPARP